MGSYEEARYEKALNDAGRGGKNTIRQECSGNWVVDHED